MIIYTRKYPLFLCLISLLLLHACKSKSGDQQHIASTPEELQAQARDLLREFVKTAVSNNGQTDDSAMVLTQPRLSSLLYEEHSFEPIWTSKELWLPAGDSLFRFIDSSNLYGLFPEDYHIHYLRQIKARFIADSLGKSDRKDAALWAKADLLLTDAFIQITKDIKLGRLPQDSISLRKDSVLQDAFFKQQIQLVTQQGISNTMHALEPTHKGYQLLKAGIRNFLANADHRELTKVPYPVKDSLVFRKALQQRLLEDGFIDSLPGLADSAQLAAAIKKFQTKKNITVDGRAGEGTIRMMNVNDRERFIRIAISMDKYKLLPEQMPSKYIWVNASGNYLELVDKDEVKINSKVICGKAKTRTPLLTSNITELITYPQWVPPSSIITKEILPAVKRDPGYLAKRGFSLVDSKGEEVDPYSVDWSKYSKGIPYRVVQGSGDANALGIMKFVFSNKYSVYLHDTNQRYLFANAMRSLSHGCVRVQRWEELAKYILRNDSALATGKNYTSIDSMTTWLQNKQKRSIAVRNKIPVYIRYFTCEGRDGSIVFFDDVYAEDRYLREKYFAAK